MLAPGKTPFESADLQLLAHLENGGVEEQPRKPGERQPVQVPQRQTGLKPAHEELRNTPEVTFSPPLRSATSTTTAPNTTGITKSTPLSSTSEISDELL